MALFQQEKPFSLVEQLMIGLASQDAASQRASQDAASQLVSQDAASSALGFPSNFDHDTGQLSLKIPALSDKKSKPTMSRHLQELK